MNGSAIVFLLWPNSRSCLVRAAADVFRHTECVCVLLANCTGNNEKEPDSADEMVRRSLCVDVVRCAMASRAYLAVCASACVCMSENCVMLSSADAGPFMRAAAVASMLFLYVFLFLDIRISCQITDIIVTRAKVDHARGLPKIQIYNRSRARRIKRPSK